MQTSVHCMFTSGLRILCFYVITIYIYNVYYMVFRLIGSCMNEQSICELYKLHSQSEQCATVGVLRELKMA